MIQYTQVEALPVSLQLAPKAAALQAAQLPPEDAHPGQLFHNLPLIVQYTGDYGNQHWYILDGGPADLEAPILPPIRPVTRMVQVPILMYHHITPYTSTDPLSDYTPPWVVPPTRFSQQMDYLKLHGYHSITLNQLFDALYYGGPLPSKPIVLTFDDGDADHYQFAYSILLAHHFSGMFYIITGQVGWASRVSWSQLREMLAHGMQIGSHTVHHVDLTRWLSISEEVVQQELQQSQRTLETQLGIIVQQFCYPYGDPFNRGTLWQRQTIATLLATDGYVGAATAFGMTGSIQQSWNPLALLRIPVFGVESFQGFMASLPWV
jgi:peptidoglycan/xylan/chitin deacetylase (PgdA/CDA1 family)